MLDKHLTALGDAEDKVDGSEIVGEPCIDRHSCLLVAVVQIVLQQSVAIALDLRPEVRIIAADLHQLPQVRRGPNVTVPMMVRTPSSISISTVCSIASPSAGSTSLKERTARTVAKPSRL